LKKQFVFFILIILLGSFGYAYYSSSSINYLSKQQADTLYCPIGNCSGGNNTYDYNVSGVAYMNRSNSGSFEADSINTTGTEQLSLYDDIITSNSGIVQLANEVTQLFAPTVQGYLESIITKGTIEPQTNKGHYYLATSSGFDIGLINGTEGTGITDRGLNFFLLDDSGTGWTNILRMTSDGNMDMVDGGDFTTHQLNMNEGIINFTTVPAPTTACVATLNPTAGNLDSTSYRYVITYYTADGETTASA